MFATDLKLEGQKMDIEKLIQERIDDLDFEQLAKDSIIMYIYKGKHGQIRESIKNMIDVIVIKEIKEIMSGPIEIGDGYHEKKKYDSFESLFKETLLKILNSRHDMDKAVERVIKSKIEDLIKNYRKEITEKIANEVLDSVKSVK
jgi:basic membrane lipoprotein Med (substrate-binding protein (PBP1-ABC) superfamily)